MNRSKPVMRDLYYTRDHGWIDFQGSVAYIGICNSRLSGIKKSKKIVFSKKGGFLNQGEVIAIFHCSDCRIPVHMPVDGKILNLNDGYPLIDQNILQMQTENDEWLAFIGLAKPYERKGLMQFEQYRLFTKRKS
jgi:glycine cleavage system H protein